MGGMFKINVCPLSKKEKHKKWTKNRQRGVWQTLDS